MRCGWLLIRRRRKLQCGCHYKALHTVVITNCKTAMLYPRLTLASPCHLPPRPPASRSPISMVEVKIGGERSLRGFDVAVGDPVGRRGGRIEINAYVCKLARALQQQRERAALAESGRGGHVEEERLATRTAEVRIDDDDVVERLWEWRWQRGDVIVGVVAVGVATEWSH
ncbi:hypothetical protein FIBSPDRAFT_930966 [Athelia psychrophila]|uniref:Uncharacterized protein n=1 Tax=Athelia psychrophila TaxID=1759441 RepID=A0A166LCJ4_9AGAM|nr:hypothetical protein FIBSPDRAFT_930966 [Fibularhizoctonia sp. CBS 109695]